MYRIHYRDHDGWRCNLAAWIQTNWWLEIWNYKLYLRIVELTLNVLRKIIRILVPEFTVDTMSSMNKIIDYQT